MHAHKCVYVSMGVGSRAAGVSVSGETVGEQTGSLVIGSADPSCRTGGELPNTLLVYMEAS